MANITHTVPDIYLQQPVNPLAATINAEKEKRQKYHHHHRILELIYTICSRNITVGGITETGQTLLNNVILACSEHQSLWSPHELKK